MIRGPDSRGGHPVWSDREGGVEVRFVGRGPDASRRRILRAAAGRPLDLAWLEQVHSARVREARPGPCGRGDALVTRRTGLALAVAAADCVPVVVAGPGRLAAIHAGWRGIAAGVVPRAVERLGGEASELAAWIGPAIGPCCYEVGDDVAERVEAASGPRAVRAGARGRPHLDLPAAVAAQLAACGVHEASPLATCTRCHPELLWSYRRDGAAAGRNLTFAWLVEPAPLGSP